MKLATIIIDGREAVAIVDPGQSLAWPLADLIPGLPAQLGGNMVSAIAHLSRLPGIAEPTGPGIALETVRLTAPILAPPHNIMCVGKNYHAHAHEFTRSGFDAGATAADAVPSAPIIFTKPSSAISGPCDDILLYPGLD